ncbi:MAG: nucleotidyltransferase, partial [Elusimicrobiota bacterium]|nr:nucleotidyltransferase [Elusimicrobiota bacterium]
RGQSHLWKIAEQSEAYFVNTVSKKFKVLPKDIEKFVRETSVLPLEYVETGVRVDVIFSITPFERKAIEKAKEIIIEGVPVRYILPEYLVVQKIIAGRARDIEDVKDIIEIQGKKININRIEKLVRIFATGDKGKEWLRRWRKLKVGGKNGRTISTKKS